MKNEEKATMMETIDTQEFDDLLDAYASRYEAESPIGMADARAKLITHIMDWHRARMAAAVDAARVASTRTYMDLLKYRVAAAREQALEEAKQACSKLASSHGMDDDDAVISECEDAIAALKSTPPSVGAQVAGEPSVFKGADGLQKLADAQAFWDQQPYGTRLYFGDGIADYLHRDVLRAAIRALYTAPIGSLEPSSAPATVDRDAVRNAVAENLHDTYHCGRIWSAWGVGTMSDDDFTPADECDHVLDSVTDAVLEVIKGQAAPAAQIPMDAIGKIVAEVIERAGANGANSVSMPDEYVAVAHFVSYPHEYGVAPVAVAPVAGEGLHQVPVTTYLAPDGVTHWPAYSHEQREAYATHFATERQPQPAAQAAVPEGFPAGALHNGEVFANQLENIYDFECQAGPLRNCMEWIELRQCLRYIADYLAAPAAAPQGVEQSQQAGKDGA